MPAMIIWVDPLGVLNGRGAFGDVPALAVADLPYYGFPVLISVGSYVFLVRPVVSVRGEEVTVRNPVRSFSFSLASEPEIERTFMGYLRFRWPGRSLVACATEVPLISDLTGSAGVQGRVLAAIARGDAADGSPLGDALNSTSAEATQDSLAPVRGSFRLWKIDLILAAILVTWLLYAWMGYRTGYRFWPGS